MPESHKQLYRAELSPLSKPRTTLISGNVELTSIGQSSPNDRRRNDLEQYMKWEEKKQEEIVELYYMGKSVSEIANELKVNRSKVSQLLLVRCPEARTPSKSALIDRIKAIGVDPSLSFSANAKRLGTDILTIKAVFHDLGLPTPTPPRNKQTDKILELRRNGLTYHEIGQMVGLSRQRVHKIVQRYGARES